VPKEAGRELACVIGVAVSVLLLNCSRMVREVDLPARRYRTSTDVKWYGYSSVVAGCLRPVHGFRGIPLTEDACHRSSPSMLSQSYSVTIACCDQVPLAPVTVQARWPGEEISPRGRGLTG